MHPILLALHRRGLCALLTALLLPAMAVATPRNGRYRADIDGLPTTITLQIHGGQVSGTYEEAALRLRLEGTVQGTRISARLIEPGKGLPVAALEAVAEGDQQLVATVSAKNPRTGEVQARQARFVRLAAGASPAPAAAAATGSIDPRLVGVWKHEKITNSGGGGNFASFTTVRTLQLGADGAVSQWVQSVGGGGNWSYNGGGRRLEFSGQWQAREGVLLVQPGGTQGFKPATRYRFSDAYLITEGTEGRQVWRR